MRDDFLEFLERLENFLQKEGERRDLGDRAKESISELLNNILEFKQYESTE